MPLFPGDEKGEEFSPDITHKSCYDQTPLKNMPVDGEIDPEEDRSPQLRGELDDSNTMRMEPMATHNPTQPGLPPEEIPGRTFLIPPNADGTRYRAKIIRQIKADKKKRREDPNYVEFLTSVNNDEYEQIVAYNDIVDYIEADHTWDGIWKFRNIIGHQGPLTRNSKGWKGSRFNVQVEWENGEITWEPIQRSSLNEFGMIDYDPVSIAIYARKNNLLNEPGWGGSRIKRLAEPQKQIVRLANQAKLHSDRTSIKWKCGYRVPGKCEDAQNLDEENGNTKWADARELELKQIDDYNTFLDKGKEWEGAPEFKRIKVHFMCDVKHDGRHKARLVAGGHLTPPPLE